MQAVPGPEPEGMGGRAPAISSRLATRLGVGLLLFGLLWRTIHYALAFPIWGDEAMLAVNLAWFDYGELTRRLENCQVAPLLFLWGERAAYLSLGPSVLALRLLPFAAGVAALLLFWRLASLLLTPHARLFAVGFLAVAGTTVSLCATVKPYSLDLLMAIGLQLLAVQWLRAPEKRGWLIALVLVTPVALLSSYPTVFVAGAVSVALLTAVRQQRWGTRWWFIAYNAALVGTFLIVLAIGKAQLANPSSMAIPGAATTKAGMEQFWAHGFPPAAPLAFLGWLLLETAGQMSAYPVGLENGGSMLTVLCCLAGGACWARHRRWTWLVLCTGPVLLTLAAAVLHRYPYGERARLMQHLAPGICLLAGLGAATLIERARRPVLPRAACTVALAAFTAAVGLGGAALDFALPYHDTETRWTDRTMRQIHALVPPSAPVVVCADPLWIGPMFTWHWLNEGPRVSWNTQVPTAALAGDQVWGFYWGLQADAACARLAKRLEERDPAWQLSARVPYRFRDPRSGFNGERCELFCFRRGGSLAASASAPGRQRWLKELSTAR